MFRDVIKRTLIVFMMFATLNMFLGCNSDHSSNYIEEDEYTTQENSEYYFDEEDVNTSGFYSSSDPYGNDVITTTLNRSGIQRYLTELESDGYYFSREYSFVQEGNGTPENSEDSIFAQFITLAMLNSIDTTRAAYILFSTCELGSIVSKYILSFVEPDPDEGFDFVTDGIWRLNYPSTVYYDKKQMSVASGVLIYDYLDCVEAGTAAGCATALIVCAFTGPAYAMCVAIGCATAFIASAIGCLFTTLDK